MGLHCLQQKYSQLFYPQSSSSTVEFISRNRAGWSQDDIEQYLYISDSIYYTYMYICIHIFTQYMCNYREGFFYSIWLHWETLERAVPLTTPCLFPWPGNAATSGPPGLPNLSWSRVSSVSWPHAGSGYEEDLMLARKWQNFCTNLPLNLDLARWHMPEGNILVKKNLRMA